MPQNKKIQQNSFYYYMKDLMKEMKQAGHTFPNGLADMVSVASPKWKMLTAYEKAPYEELAREAKSKKSSASQKTTGGNRTANTTTVDGRMDCTGKLLANRCEPYEELAIRYDQQENEVTSKWPIGAEMLNKKFCLVNFQTMCKTSEDEYLPLEVAVLEYSMKEGITRELHQFINAGPIPVGYRYEAQQHSESTHQIPIENFELAQHNYSELWAKLLEFSDNHGLYCLSKDFKEMEYCVYWVQAQSEAVNSPYIRLYALEKLVMDLFKHIGHPVAKYQILDMLTTTAFDYEPNTRCPWHEELGLIHCSLALIRRYAYAMSDSLTNVYEFSLTAHHLPVKDQRIKGVSLNPPHFGNRKTNSARVFPSQRNNRPVASASSPNQDQEFPEYDNTDVYAEAAATDEDEEMTALRQPTSRANVVSASNKTSIASASNKTSIASAFKSNHSYLDIGDNEEFPTLGRGMQFGQSGQSASPRTSAPLPSQPSCWQKPKPSSVLPRYCAVGNQARPLLQPMSAPLAATTLNMTSRPRPPPPANSTIVAPQAEVASILSASDFPALTAFPRGVTPSNEQQAAMKSNLPSVPCFAAMVGRGRGRGPKPNTGAAAGSKSES